MLIFPDAGFLFSSLSIDSLAASNEKKKYNLNKFKCETHTHTDFYLEFYVQTKRKKDSEVAD